MKLTMQCSISSDELCAQHWRTSISGEAIDERGDKANEFVERHSLNKMKLIYKPETFELSIVGGQTCDLEIATSLLEEHLTDAMLVEATTLGFPELLALCRAAKEKKGKLSILYAEPSAYRHSVGVPSVRHMLHRRDFALSEETPNFTAVPGFTRMCFGDQRIKSLILVGYEGGRLNRRQPISITVNREVPMCYTFVAKQKDNNKGTSR